MRRITPPGIAPDESSPDQTGTLPFPSVDMPQTTMKDTKMGKLLKYGLPLVQGGLTGAFGGNWRVPGSGFQAAQQATLNQRQLALQRLALQRAIANDRALRDYREAEAQRARNYEGQQTKDLEMPDGTKHTFQYNPRTGTYDKDLGVSGRGTATRPEIADTSQGLIENVPGTTRWKRVQIENDQPSAQGEPGQEGWSVKGTAPPESEPEATSMPSEPLHRYQKPPAPQRMTSRDASGRETTAFVTPEPGVSATREPRPTKPTRGRQPPKPDTGTVETYVQSFLKKSNNDPQTALNVVGQMNIPSDIKGRIQKRLEDIQRQQQAQQRKGRGFSRFVNPQMQKQFQQGQTGGIPAEPTVAGP